MSAELSRLAARLSVQERQTTALQVRIEELSQDMNASFQQQARYQIAMEQTLDERFDKIDARFVAMDARFDKVEAEIAGIRSDMAGMETRMLDAFKQLITLMDTRLPPSP